jgi:hypothetical protein
VSRFLTQAWVDEFNAALAGTPLAVPEDVISLAAEGGHLGVLQQVSGVPHAPDDGTVRTLLRIDDETAHLSVVEAADDATGANVTVSLDYGVAAAMSRGDLDPAEALGTGRIKVRGDLAVLVAAQAVLTASADLLRQLHRTTTY